MAQAIISGGFRCEASEAAFRREGASPREGQGGRTAVVLVYVEDADAAGRQSGWSAPVGASQEGGGVLPHPLAHWLKAEERPAPIGHDPGRREASSAASSQRASRPATAWPIARCRRHPSAVRGNLSRVCVTFIPTGKRGSHGVLRGLHRRAAPKSSFALLAPWSFTLRLPRPCGLRSDSILGRGGPPSAIDFRPSTSHRARSPKVTGKELRRIAT
jgi:hypothetical protein